MLAFAERKKHMKRGALFIIVFICMLTASHATAYYNNENISVLDSSEESLTLRITLPAQTISPCADTNQKRIHIEGMYENDRQGEALVPVMHVLVEIPDGGIIDIDAFPEDTISVSDILLPVVAARQDGRGTLIAQSTGDDGAAGDTPEMLSKKSPERMAEIVCTGFIRDKRIAKIRLCPVQYNPATHEAVVYKRMLVTISFGNTGEGDSPAIMWQEKTTIPQDDLFNDVYRSALINYSPYAMCGPKREHELYTASSSLPTVNESPFTVKIITAHEGMHKVTYTDLAGLGIDLSNTTHESLRLFNREEEIAHYTSGSGLFVPGDYILFYAQSFKSLYTKENVYRLYQTDESGKRMGTRNGQPIYGYDVQASFENSVRAEQDTIYWAGRWPYEDDKDHWFWERLSIIEQTRTKALSVYLPHPDTAARKAGMSLNLKGETDTMEDPDHHTRVSLNGTMIDDFTWNGGADLVREIKDVDAAFLKDGENIITLEADNDTGSIVDAYYVNWIEMVYMSRFMADNDTLKFYKNSSEGQGFVIEGFSESDIRVFDITDHANPVVIDNAAVTKNDTYYRVSFEENSPDNKTYVSVGGGAFRHPERLIADEQSNLRSERENIDYIIITHEDFFTLIHELKIYRELQGLSVEVVKIDNIYDEFSYGFKDASAIKDFLAYAYNNWNAGGHPTYVLLVGDASVDYRDDKGYFSQGKTDFIPTYLYQTPGLGDTPTDNWFVSVNGSDHLPDMIIGRMCVKTEDDLDNIIRKIKKYESGELSPWCGNVILSADNDEPIFETISDSVASLMPEGVTTPHKIYLGQYDSAESATDDLIAKINKGAVITSYVGHGYIDKWAVEKLFLTAEDQGDSRNDVEKLLNNDRLTFVLVMNCMAGFFASFADSYSLAEEFVRSDDKGAVACIAPTAWGYPSDHKVFEENIFYGFFTDEIKTAGALMYQAKINTYQEIVSREIVETFTFFGDPATQLKLVPDSSTDYFTLLTPEDNETVSSWPPPTFTWRPGIYDFFTVQFSTDMSFGRASTITAPWLPFLFPASGVYTLDLFTWAVLAVLSSNTDTFYWRVVPCDISFDFLDRYSEYRRFSFGR